MEKISTQAIKLHWKHKIIIFIKQIKIPNLLLVETSIEKATFVE